MAMLNNQRVSPNLNIPNLGQVESWKKSWSVLLVIFTSQPAKDNIFLWNAR